MSVRRAFSLVEVIISIAILGVLMVGALNAVAYAARDRRTTAELALGRSLAAGLAKEIMSQRFADPNSSATAPVSIVNRIAFNNIEDYAGLTESPPVNRDGSRIAGADGWQRTVSVQRSELDTDTFALTNAGSSASLIKFTITAISPGGKAYTLVACRSAFGAPDVPTPTAGMLTALRLELRSGEHTLASVTDLVNLPP